jgi:spore germination protein KC
MKKILILLFFIFISTGCYDYKELDNLAIISGIAIDYNQEENEYNITFEILNDDKIAENLESSNKTYYVNGSGKNITDAFNNTALEINKIPYYSHIKVMIVSEEILKNHSEDIIDYIIRNSYITNMFYMTVSKDYNASEIIQSTSTENRVISESIYKLIDNTDLGNSLSVKINFEDYVSTLVNPMQDVYLPTVTLEDNKLKLQGIAIFDDNEIKNILNYNESQTLNVLFNENKNAYYEISCDNNENEIIDVYKQKINYKITKNKAVLNINLMAKIEENQCNYDLKDTNTYKKLEKKFNNVLKDDILKLLNNLKQNNSDVLGINYMYFKNNNKTLNFNNLEFEVNVTTSINKNGLIFEVKNDNK